MNAADRRPLLLAVATANAVLLYLDRICMGEIVKTDLFRAEMGLSKEQTGALMSSFFFAYALGQVPAGYLADRFGPRRMLAVYVALWSLFTAATGLAGGLAGLIAWRVLTGLSEAGAYPASGRMIRAWFADSSRGRASSCVATGGRVGNAAALFLTASLIAALGAWRPVLWLYGSFGIVLAAMSWMVFQIGRAHV